jgi:hypothetical protein
LLASTLRLDIAISPAESQWCASRAAAPRKVRPAARRRRPSHGLSEVSPHHAPKWAIWARPLALSTALLTHSYSAFSGVPGAQLLARIAALHRGHVLSPAPVWCPIWKSAATKGNRGCSGLRHHSSEWGYDGPTRQEKRRHGRFKIAPEYRRSGRLGRRSEHPDGMSLTEITDGE